MVIVLLNDHCYLRYKLFVINSFAFLFQLSYQIVDSMIWLGIRDIINDFRKKKLKLRPVTYLSGSHGKEYDIPHGYIWSPRLVPKPKG
jgi:sterol 3beta-glucosyltransferase